MIKIIDNSIVEHNLAVLRDRNSGISQFRNAVDRISKILAIEAYSGLKTNEITIETPIEETKVKTISEHVVLLPVLRAGIGLLQPFIDVYPEAETGFIGLKRNEETIEAEEYHFSLPPLKDNSHIFILEIMLATGGSVAATIARLRKDGVKRISVVSIISAPEGIENLQSKFTDIDIITAAIDRKLNDQSYIVPGLGDAGDRLTGTTI